MFLGGVEQKLTKTTKYFMIICFKYFWCPDSICFLVLSCWRSVKPYRYSKLPSSCKWACESMLAWDVCASTLLNSPFLLLLVVLKAEGIFLVFVFDHKNLCFNGDLIIMKDYDYGFLLDLRYPHHLEAMRVCWWYKGCDQTRRNSNGINMEHHYSALPLTLNMKWFIIS